MREDGRSFASLPPWLRKTIPEAAAAQLLTDVQSNILRPESRPQQLYAFARFRRDIWNEASDWLANFTTEYVRSCADQVSQGVERETTGNVSFAASFYHGLGLEPPPDRCFRGGMKRANLNDPPVELWEPAFQQECDAMISLGVRENGSLEQARAVLASLEPCCEFLFVQEGGELLGGIEHFGFVEGISQPLFLDEDVGRSGSSQAATPLQVVLARDPYGAGECSYGTYVVFRKLRQDVALFELGLRRMAAELGISDELAGAMTIGRFKDGTPLAVAAERGTGKHNAFDYSEDVAGAKCPFASHVRRSNPRGELDHVSHGPDWLSRIARRGLPYGHAGDADVGLLFVCYQSDISLGFELIQNNWCNFPDFPRVSVGVDPIIGQKNTWDPTEGQCWPAEGTETGTARFGFPHCVTMLGGEYFFQPSLSFLHSIGDLKAGKGCCKGPQL